MSGMDELPEYPESIRVEVRFAGRVEGRDDRGEDLVWPTPGTRYRDLHQPIRVQFDATCGEFTRRIETQPEVATQIETQLATLGVRAELGTIEAEPVQVRAGQAAEGRVTLDSATGTIGTAEIDVFDVDG